MASQEVVPGYRMRRSALVPVQAGDLTVQLVAEYEGLDVVGRIVRIENSSAAPVEITEARIAPVDALAVSIANPKLRSEEHTSELQSLMRISYAVFCLKKKNRKAIHKQYTTHRHQ